MTDGWLDPLTRVLDDASAPLTFFFRDDDVGPDEQTLYRLLDLFALYGVPLDLAVIPARLEPALAERLVRYRQSGATLVGLHQHGFAHVNHEPIGRKCEFGPARDYAAQYCDIAAGRERLERLLGDTLDRFFTPPWNRCTQATVDCLAALGFTMLSRDCAAAPLGLDGLAEAPVDVDWSKHAAGAPPLGAAMASALEVRGSCGVMLHHAAMNAAQFDALEQLLDFVTRHRRARCVLLRALQPIREELPS